MFEVLAKLSLAVIMLLHGHPEGMLTIWGVECSSWIALSRGSTRRSELCPMGDCRAPSVIKANLLMSRRGCGERSCLYNKHLHTLYLKRTHTYILPTDAPSRSFLGRPPKASGFAERLSHVNHRDDQLRSQAPARVCHLSEGVSPASWANSS